MKVVIKNKQYKNGPQLFENQSFEFDKKGLYTIVGPSGVGKTTLLNIITGLDFDFDGACYYEDELIAKNKKQFDKFRMSNIGYVFQEGLLFESLTVKQNLKIVLEHIKIPNDEIDSLIEQNVKTFGIEDLIDQKVNKLSGGQRQRVGIARALLTNPAYIIADEPTASLDAENKIIVMDALKKLSNDHVVIVVSHDKIVDAYADIQYKFTFDGKVTKTTFKTLHDGIEIKNLVRKKFNLLKYFKLIAILLHNKSTIIPIAIITVSIVFLITFIFSMFWGSIDSAFSKSEPPMPDNVMVVTNQCSYMNGYEGYGGAENVCVGQSYGSNSKIVGEAAINYLNTSPYVKNYYINSEAYSPDIAGHASVTLNYNPWEDVPQGNYMYASTPVFDTDSFSVKEQGGAENNVYQPPILLLPIEEFSLGSSFTDQLKNQTVAGGMPQEINEVIIPDIFAEAQFDTTNYNEVIGESVEWCFSEYDESKSNQNNCINLTVSGVYASNDDVGYSLYIPYSNQAISFDNFGDFDSTAQFSSFIIEFNEGANKEAFVTEFKQAIGTEQLDIYDKVNQQANTKETISDTLKTLTIVVIIFSVILFIMTFSLMKLRFKTHNNTFVLLRTIGYTKNDVFITVFLETLIINLIFFTIAIFLVFIATSFLNARNYTEYANYFNVTFEEAKKMSTPSYILSWWIAAFIYCIALIVTLINSLLTTMKVFRKDITIQIDED